MNTTAGAVNGELIRVRSASCGSSCGADDLYRLRAYETTASIPRFNNSSTQVTVVILHNRAAAPVSQVAFFWNAAGALLHQQPFALAGRASVTLNTAGIPALAGQSGSVTVVHDGRYGDLTGKGVALEPSTGLAFDSVLVPRPRQDERAGCIVHVDSGADRLEGPSYSNSSPTGIRQPGTAGSASASSPRR